MSVRPEPESGEQICCLFNEVGVVRSQRPALPPDLLLRLLSEFIESSHESAVSHRSGETVTTPWFSGPGDAFAGVTLHIDRCCIRSASETMAIASALSGDGHPRLRMSSFDSILTRPRESMPHFDGAELSGQLVLIRSMSISPCSNRSRCPVVLRSSVDEPFLVDRNLAAVVGHHGPVRLG
jgi:hypothetical protein